MSRTKVCFLGTPEFAAVHLESLLKNPGYEVVGVVTQPDRPAGRNLQLTPSAVKTVALAHGLPVVTPEKLRREPDTFEQIKSWRADVAVVVAFGQILAQEFIDSFNYGAVNVHGSLLPRWRGAAPIQRALEAGDTVTGVCLQKMVKKLDAGPVIGERRIELNDEINATELYALMSQLGCELLHDDLKRYLDGTLTPKIQDESQMTLAPKIEKDESLINWRFRAAALHNRVRAFSMGPGTYVMLQGKRLKIHRTKVVTGSSGLTPGCVSVVSETELYVQAGQDQISVLEIQPESKAKMPIAEFLKSVQLKRGDRLV